MADSDPIDQIKLGTPAPLEPWGKQVLPIGTPPPKPTREEMQQAILHGILR